MRHFIIFVAIASYLYFIFEAFKSLYFGGIPFWFDPARDLLLATNNLNKLSLIGQPTGIPGVFYGPFWIWLSSFALLFSHDPRVVSFIILGLPYFIILPFLLIKMRKIFGLGILIFFILFFGTYSQYATALWNPNLAPLLLVGITFCVYKNARGSYLVAGILTGLLTSFHLSIFLAVCTAFFCYFLGTFVIKRNYGVIIYFLIYILGVFIPLLPLILFEFRHGFNITNSILATFDASVNNIAIVGQTGLSTSEIISKFILIPINFLHLHIYIIIGLFVINLIYSISRLNRVVIFLLILLFLIVFIYVMSKNPVWDYHFIGIETLELLLFVATLPKNMLYRSVIFFWSFATLIPGIFLSVVEFPPKYWLVPGLSSKEHVVRTIFSKAGEERFSWFSYDPGIYTYDYDYLFAWISKSYPNKPVLNAANVYLIVPPGTSTAVKDDFVNYKTPSQNYRTISTYQNSDNTLIINRQKTK